MEDIIICRCEDITEREIREAIRKHGFTTIDEIRKNIRAGMGMCQGRTCGNLVRRILSEETGKSISEIFPPRRRQPVKPVEIKVFVEGEK